jgi:hypothetical protein
MARNYFDVAFLDYDTVIATVDFITESVMLWSGLTAKDTEQNKKYTRSLQF